MPVPNPPTAYGHCLGRQILAGCRQPLPGVGPSRRYLRESFPTCLDPYPGCSCGALTRFFPQDFGLPRVMTGSALGWFPVRRLPHGSSNGAAVIHQCSGPRVCSPPRLEFTFLFGYSDDMKTRANLTTFTSILRACLPFLRGRYQVESLGVFGSFVRDDQRAKSDLDLLVSFRRPPSLLQFIELENYLSDLLGIRVELDTIA